MSTPAGPSRLTLSASDIAQVAGVGRSTVSNWRQRHDDFPEPVSGEGTRLRYAGTDVHDWLKANGKQARELSSDQILWSLLDAWRGQAAPEDAGRIIGDLITWRFVSDPASAGFEVTLPDQAWWPSLMESQRSPETWDRIQVGMRAYEGSHPEHAPLFMIPLLDSNGSLGQALHQPDLQSASLDAVNSLDASRLNDAFISFQDRLTRTGRRGYDEFATSDVLVDLIATVAASTPGPVHDPVVGSGRMLMAAASQGRNRSMLTGQDVNASACVQAKQRALLAGHTKVNIRQGDVFQSNFFAPRLAQVVVMDPPYGLQWSRAAVLYLDPRLTYGTPPKSTMDLAWLQLGVWYLGPQGRAFILQPPGSAFRGSGPEVTIRTALLRAGTIEAIVALPPGLASHTQIPLHLWVLARPGETADPNRVLMIDHSKATDIDAAAIAAALQEWRDHRTISVNLSAEAFTVAEMLADQANLVPRRWIASSDDVPGVDEVRAAVGELHLAVANLREPANLTSDSVITNIQAPKSVTLTELEKAGTLAVLRASGKARQTKVAYSVEGTPVVTGQWIRGNDDSRRLDLDLLDEDPVITRPGDVLLQNAGGLAARVDTEGGRALTSPSFYLLRLSGDVLSPDYLAEFLVSTQNHNQAQGATIQRVRLQDMKIRVLHREQQEQVIERLVELRTLQASANTILLAADTTRQHLIDAVTAGTVDIT